MKFSCFTLFDITATGVTGHYKQSRIPFNDQSGAEISTESTWNHARNQQRNWETIQQVISLRTQINNATPPVKQEQGWYFEFETDTPDVFGTQDNPVTILVQDADLVPMLIGLLEHKKAGPTLHTQGPRQNIWFKQST
jgi:hypothetical protein